MNDDYDGKVTDELAQIYKEAEADGIWLREISPDEETGRNIWIAAAGEMSTLKETEKQKPGWKIDVYQLSIEDLVKISVPGTGATREDACREAIKALKEHRANRN